MFQAVGDPFRSVEKGRLGSLSGGFYHTRIGIWNIALIGSGSKKWVLSENYQKMVLTNAKIVR
uniref:Uncharacterized protein n=1 Tax=Romanomermis culicivorax TaxID=13658 RepID=A0A915INY3_ROMCU